ncbi:hypothetical protein HRbin36_01900 [bacterium HR36]|nr:hypothetical protein HRbin36_01900 [bacterium HR36]
MAFASDEVLDGSGTIHGGGQQMRGMILGLMLASAGATWAQNAITVGNAPRLNVSGQGTVVPTIGAAPRLGSVTPSAGPVFVPVDVASRSVVPLTAVQPTAFRPRQPSILDRLAQLLPFAAKTGATIVAPEAVILHDSLPSITIR